MSKYKPLFLSEADEHLRAMEGDLVALERTPDALDRIQEVFRHLHSLKGMAAAMGYNPMAQLAHRLEDLLAPLRTGPARLRPEDTDILLTGLDELRAQLQAVGADREPPTASAALLARLPAAPQPAPTGPGVVDDDDEIAPDAPLYEVVAQVAPDCSLPSVRAFLVYKRLDAVGRITSSEPPLAEVRAGRLPGGALRVRLQTERRQAELQRLVANIPELAEVTVSVLSAPSAPPAASSAAPAAAPPQVSEPAASVRVRAEVLDFFVDTVGELLTLRSAFEDAADSHASAALRDLVRRFGALVRRLQDRVMEVRMVPVRLLTDRLPRVCRDMARSRGKQVELEVHGAEVELDRALVEALDNPLLHLMRNAIDHGIESPEARQAAGKTAAGRLELSIERLGERVRLTLADDGAGVDPAAVLRAARARGLVGPTERPETERLLALLFEPGFSTRETVGDVSGRGVGLDAVRSAVERVGGRVTLSSEPGRGTRFALDLPLTLAILQVLLVESAGHLLALPASRVLRAMNRRADQMETVPGGTVVLLGGQRYTYADLGALLRARPATTGAGELLLLGTGDQPQLALGVDRVRGHREAVLKPPGRLLRELGPFNGATVLGDGRPVLILDADALIELGSSTRRETGT